MNGSKYHSHGGRYQPTASTSYISSDGFLDYPSTQKRLSLTLSDLTGQIIQQSKHAVGIGGFADVFKASWNSENVRLSGIIGYTE